MRPEASGDRARAGGWAENVDLDWHIPGLVPGRYKAAIAEVVPDETFRLIASGSFAGKLLNMYPVEAAIVAILSAAGRMGP